MIETRYKSAEELRYSIGERKKVAIVSCGACANLCDVGGVRGMKFIRRLAEEWGNTVVSARTIVAYCPVPIMREAQKRLLKSSEIDMLLVISCAAGVKSAFLCDPKVPVVAVCDTVGAASVTNPEAPMDTFIEHTLCASCGQCVISYTAGICPLASCPARVSMVPATRSLRKVRGACATYRLQGVVEESRKERSSGRSTRTQFEERARPGSSIPQSQLA